MQTTPLMTREVCVALRDVPRTHGKWNKKVSVVDRKGHDIMRYSEGQGGELFWKLPWGDLKFGVDVP